MCSGMPSSLAAFSNAATARVVAYAPRLRLVMRARLLELEAFTLEPILIVVRITIRFIVGSCKLMQTNRERHIQID